MHFLSPRTSISHAGLIPIIHLLRRIVFQDITLGRPIVLALINCAEYVTIAMVHHCTIFCGTNLILPSALIVVY